MKYFILVLIFGWNNLLFSQNWKLAFKTGAANSLAAPVSSNESFAYNTIAHSWVLPTIGLEINHTNKNKKHFFAGVVLFPVSGSFGFNSKNIDVSKSAMPSLSIYDYNVQVYAGIEYKFIKRNAPKSKNYFSIIGGIGLNYFYYNSGESGIKVISLGKTVNGETLIGMDAGMSNNVFGAPSIFAGARYNFTNSKGNKVASIELQLNYGVVKYFDWRIKYQMNGEQKIDYIPEHGFNIQLNILVPIFNFNKKNDL